MRALVVLFLLGICATTCFSDCYNDNSGTIFFFPVLWQLHGCQTCDSTMAILEAVS